MIVIGLDVHKQSVTAVAVDEAGRPLAEKVIVVGSEELLGWAAAFDTGRLWAVEDCRQLTGWLERQLLGVGEQLVRVPPKLTVPERRAGRTRGKSDPIDALAIARAALREPGLSRPRPDERVYRELKLLVDHRDDVAPYRAFLPVGINWDAVAHAAARLPIVITSDNDPYCPEGIAGYQSTYTHALQLEHHVISVAGHLTIEDDYIP